MSGCYFYYTFASDFQQLTAGASHNFNKSVKFGRYKQNKIMADVLTKIVPRESIDGSTFHVPKDGSAGCRILPNGTRITINATPTTSANSKSPNNSNRKQRYLQYKHALGKDKHILVSHAVYLAWVGAIPDGYVIDHLNGVTADNRAENLQAIIPQENTRRVPYLHALRELIPNHWQTFQREDYLRFYAMPLAEFKAVLGKFKRVDPNTIRG